MPLGLVEEPADAEDDRLLDSGLVHGHGRVQHRAVTLPVALDPLPRELRVGHQCAVRACPPRRQRGGCEAGGPTGTAGEEVRPDVHRPDRDAEPAAIAAAHDLGGHEAVGQDPHLDGHVRRGALHLDAGRGPQPRLDRRPGRGEHELGGGAAVDLDAHRRRRQRARTLVAEDEDHGKRATRCRPKPESGLAVGPGDAPAAGLAMVEPGAPLHRQRRSERRGPLGDHPFAAREVAVERGGEVNDVEAPWRRGSVGAHVATRSRTGRNPR